MLKFYEIEGRFPSDLAEIPHAAVGYVADLVKVPVPLFATYSLASRSAEYHRAQIRGLFGTREVTEADEERWARWLAADVCLVETDAEHLAAALRERCLTERVEAPTGGQVERVVGSAGRRFEKAFTVQTVNRLGPGSCARLDELCRPEGRLAELKADPGSLGPETMLAELGKLAMARAVGVGDEVFVLVSDRQVAAWRARAMRMYPSDFLACSDEVRHTLLAALCWTRQAEITDALVQLLIDLIHRINARAERGWKRS
jgi:Domain of unknown function (DUF4158)